MDRQDAGLETKDNRKISDLSGEIAYFATGLYFLLLFVIFPLYLEDHYRNMASCKWKFYLYITVPYLTVMSFCWLSGVVGRLRGTGKRQTGQLSGICDWLVGLYGICMLISWFLGFDRQEAWTGTEGWYMGAAAQLLFVGTYFAVSRSRISVSWIVGCNAVGSGICFLIGILQRLGIDVLGLYLGMPDVELSDFLSTIGNRTWVSGYACAVFPIGIFLFWQSGWQRDCQNDDSGAGHRTFRFLWGLYSAVAFAGLAATYSDSVYMGLAAVLFVLGVFSLGDGRKFLSFCQVLLVWFGSALLMCGVRALCGDKVRDARGLTCYVYEWKWMLAGLALCAAVTALVYRVCYRKQSNGSEIRRRLQVGCLLGGGILCVLTVGFVALNSTGTLEKLFHITVRNRYLFFDDAWGDARGWIWRTVCQMFGDLPLSRKLFGVGPDCFAAYSYSIPEYAVQLRSVWGNAVLANAHNEWLNMFFCQGIVGGLIYLGIFVSAVCAGVRNMFGEPEISVGTDDLAVPEMSAGRGLLPGIGLCAVAYMAHNFFCYQQICATGPMFVLLGVLAALLRGQGEDGGLTDRTTARMEEL